MPDTIYDALGTRSVRHTSDTLAVGDVAYTWDSAGRVSGKDAWTFHYGPSGQLTHASRPGRDIDFIYDEADQRILKRVDGALVRANVAGGVLTEDHFVELVEVGGVVAGVLDNGQFTALLADPRGTPFAGPDGTPNLATPYGVRASHLGYAEVLDYTRLGWDADLDVVRMGVRDYDPRLAQFLTPDPLYFENGSLRGMVVGFETRVDGLFKRFRIDWDPDIGAHINVEIEKGAERQKFHIT